MVKGFKPPSEKIPKAPAPRLSQRPVVEPGRIPRSPDLIRGQGLGLSKGMGGGGPGLPRGPSMGGMGAGRASSAGGGFSGGPSSPPSSSSAAPPPPDDAESDSGPNGNGGSGIGFKRGGVVHANRGAAKTSHEKNTDVKRERLDDNKKKTHKQLNSDPKVRHW